jgi:hypothetical protein
MKRVNRLPHPFAAFLAEGWVSRREAQVSSGYRKPSLSALRIANKSEVNERISDDWRFRTLVVGQKERSIGNHRGRLAAGDGTGSRRGILELALMSVP